MNNLSLYLHFPFCRRKCRYCDFYSLPNLSRIRAYESALCRSIAFFGKGAGEYLLETVYFGGGTPSLATPDGVREIFSSVREYFAISEGCEITVEMNPESAGDAILSAYRRGGANRLSLGMQSAIDSELISLGRLHDFSRVKDAVKRARAHGFSNISLDLMYGLPGQDLSSFRESLDQALSLEPEHLSFYLLTLSPTVPLYREKELLPDDEAVREMYLFASDYVQKMGFEHYEISNAAKKGFRSRHNEVYWKGGEYLGLGPGAHSLYGGKRFFVKEGVEEFILASNPLDRLSRQEKLSLSDRRTEYVMLSLRTKEGLDLKKLLSLSDPVFAARAEKKMKLWSEHGLCTKTDCGFALTTEGFFVSNEMITELI